MQFICFADSQKGLLLHGLPASASHPRHARRLREAAAAAAAAGAEVQLLTDLGVGILYAFAWKSWAD